MVFADHLLGPVTTGRRVAAIDVDEIKVAVQVNQMGVAGAVHHRVQQIAFGSEPLFGIFGRGHVMRQCGRAEHCPVLIDQNAAVPITDNGPAILGDIVVADGFLLSS